MSATNADWSLLGITATGDRRTIRSAYARQLKAIDPEIDPQAFLKLRNAYERILADVDAPVGDALSEQTEPYDRPQDGLAQPEEDLAEEHARAIFELLFDGTDRLWLDPDGQAALIRHWQVLIADPRMEKLDHSDRVERWASAIIAGASPRSAPILMLAAERFGWAEAGADVHSNRDVADIARRYRLLQLLHRAARVGSRHHPAWIELHKPSDDFSGSGLLEPQTVFELIAATRYALPQLAEAFDPVRLISWELRAEEAHLADAAPLRRGLSPRASLYLTLALIIAIAVGVRMAFAQ